MDDLTLARAVASDAAHLALRLVSPDAETSATTKPDGSLVTRADLAVEKLLRQRIREARPDDAVLGEEFGRSGDATRVWVIDPIDGTSSFASGGTNWRVHVALMVGDDVEVGVVIAPAMGQAWWARRGHGATSSAWPETDASARPLRLHMAQRPTRVASITGSRGPFDQETVSVTCRHLPLIDLVDGHLDAFVAEKYFAWDHAPWTLIVSEAGGRFVDVEGGTRPDVGGGTYVARGVTLPSAPRPRPSPKL